MTSLSHLTVDELAAGICLRSGRIAAAEAELVAWIGEFEARGCRFPGCTRHRKLHAHHVVFWSNGGPTDLDNLVLVCSRHHTLIHNQGFQLVLHPDRRLDVRTAEGIPLLHLPTRPWGDPDQLDPQRQITPATITPPHHDPTMNLHYVVSVLLQQSA